MRVVALMLSFAAVLMAQRDPFAGSFQGDKIALELKGAAGKYTGTLTYKGEPYPASVTAAGNLANGTFSVGGRTYAFTLTPFGNGFKLVSEGKEYLLARKLETIAAPPSAAAPAAPAAPADTPPPRPAPGPARVAEDIPAPAGAINPSTPARSKEEAGAGGVHMELVGKWCWMSQVYAQQGARQSNRCITLNGNGTYQYAGLTDSYNPYGGATMERSDSGTWTATETTLTARSVSGRVIVYRLEKRNHPKNRDPMIVLNGDTFVTYYNKPPW